MYAAKIAAYRSPTKITDRFIIFGQEQKQLITETETAIIPGWREFGINCCNRNSNNSVHVAPGGAENTRWDIYRRQLSLRRNYRNFFWMVVFCYEQFHTEGSERPDAEAP